MKNRYFNLGMILALVLGGTLGYFDISSVGTFAKTVSTLSIFAKIANALNTFVEVISILFINMLKLISLPMIFLAIVSTMTRMNSLSEAHLLLRKILKYTIITTLIAATIGMLLFILIHPVKTSISNAETIPLQGSYFSFLINIIPENPIQPFLENNVLAVAFIATILSVAILKLPKEKSYLLRDFFNALFDALLKLASGLILLMPIGVFAFTFQFVQSLKKDDETLEKLMLYALCVIAANLIQGFITLPLMLKMKGISPSRTAKGMLPALTMAFFTKSSNAALPITLDCVNRLGVSDKTARFSLPLCSIINMNGCAAFILITILFVCASQGITFTPFQMIPWIFLASLAAIGNAGVPMGCFFLTTAFLVGMGVPIEMMGMILPLYSLFDMVETALNVWSDGCITTTVDKELKAVSSETATIRALKI